MQSSLNIKLLVFFAGLLILVKFALLPIIQWQNQKVDDIRQYDRRNVKAQNLLANKEKIFMRMATLDKAYQSEAKPFPSFEDKASFRLETQMMFDMLLKQYGLSRTQFFWRDSEDKQVFDNLYKAKFNVDFGGKLKDFALFHTALVTSNPNYRIANMSLRIAKQSDKSMGTVNATLTIEAFYWLGGIQ